MVAGVALALVGIAVTAGWFYPVSLRPSVRLDRLTAYVPSVTVRDASEWLVQPVQALWGQATAWQGTVPLSPMALWALAAGMVVLVVAFNLTQTVDSRERGPLGKRN